MKKIYFFIIFLLFCISNKLAAQKLVFDYDAAGNQTLRQWVCVNCPQAIAAQPKAADRILLEKKEKELLKDENPANFRVLTASPNPVEEMLTVRWKNSDSTFVKSIAVITMNGNKVLEQIYSLDVQESFFSFTSLPPGLYVLLATYNDQKKQTVKIIKK